MIKHKKKHVILRRNRERKRVKKKNERKKKLIIILAFMKDRKSCNMKRKEGKKEKRDRKAEES